MTPEEINALPDRVRSYIHDLETSYGNTAHIIQQNFALREENAALRLLTKEQNEEKMRNDRFCALLSSMLAKHTGQPNRF